MSFEHKLILLCLTIAVCVAKSGANSISSFPTSPIGHIGESVQEPKKGSTQTSVHHKVHHVTSQTSNSSIGPTVSMNTIHSSHNLQVPTTKPLHSSPAIVGIQAKPADQQDLDLRSQKYSEYIRPICNSYDRLSESQIKRIHLQFKTFVDETNGKLGQCYFEQYGFNPILRTINITDLTNICPPKHVPLESKPSYVAFLKCAGSVWSQELDKDLSTILGNRLIGASHHRHVVDDPSLDAVHHDSDDASLIDSIVKRVMTDEQSLANDTDFKIIDMSDKKPPTSQLQNPNAPTSEPTVIVWVNDTSSAEAPQFREVSLQGPAPNTALATSVKSDSAPFVDQIPNVNAGSKFIGEFPSLAVNGSHQTTLAPIVVAVDLTTTTKAPLILQFTSPKSHISSTSKRPIIIAHSTTVLPLKIQPKTTKPIKPKVTTQSPKPKQSTTTTTTTTLAPASSSTTREPEISVEELKKQHEKEKEELEKKYKAEKEELIAKIERQKKESAAQQAIQSLQQQRKLSPDHKDDSKIHKEEHERQMVSISDASNII